MTIQFNKVTWYSKLIAVIIFIGVIPAITFCLGREYQKTIDFIAGSSQSPGSINLLANQNRAAQTKDTTGPANATYTIDDEAVTLKSGVSTVPSAAGSVSEIETQIFGQPFSTDITGDGQADAVVLLVQTTGGTGVFYYVAAAVKSGDQYIGTNAVFLGDRIAPQNITATNGKIAVNYADRKPDEAFNTRPSVGVTKYIAYQNGALVELGK